MRTQLFTALDELAKLGAISSDQAQRSLDRLDTLDKQKPTAGQVARYGGVGALAGAGIGAMRDIIAPKPGASILSRQGLRVAAGNALGGAITAGAIPLLHKHLDRRAEVGTLKKFVAQPDDMQKAAAGQLLEQVEALLNDAEYIKTASADELEELRKLALGLADVRRGIATATARVAPTLNRPVMQAAQQGVHSLQHSPNSFAQGMGNILHHKVQSPGKMFLGAVNPVGTAAETLAGGAGTAASKGLAGLGGKLQAAHGPADAVIREGRAMTPFGRLRNAAGDVGGRTQQSFSAGGMGHNIATKYMPRAAEIGGAVGAGLAVHAPVGLAGVLGKGVVGGAAHLAPALGDLAHGAAGHLAEDVIGTGKQGLIGSVGRRIFGGAASAARQSMLPAAM